MFHSVFEIICNSDACARKDTVTAVNIPVEGVRAIFEDTGWRFLKLSREELTYCPDHASEA